jgi:hypothetical protein
MSIATFSLPIDIPWQRIAFSEDMMDEVACDRELPLRFRSSVAVFAYEPPVDQQRTDDFRVSYLKVACTITGYQPSQREIRIRERLVRSGWTHQDKNEYLQEVVGKYYACYGAMLEVVVAPHPEDKFKLVDYPYFADFDPKKRELYEMVSETGEVMSRSLEDVNVRLGQTTLQSHEVRDKTNLGAALSGSYSGVTASGTVANESGTTDLSQQGTENIRTTDAAREARETFSHTTQLSQLYHQLDSYHIGTNRAVFFVLPRPHTVQSPITFVNGPREIEGVQEFMLVVVRPKEMENFCVEAYLETAHLTHDAVPDEGKTIRPLSLKIDAPITENDDRAYLNPVTDTRSSDTIVGKVIDMSRGGGYPPATGSLTGAGYDVLQPINAQGPFPPDIAFTVASDHVEVTATATGLWNLHPPEKHPASLDLHATVYYKNAVPGIAGYTDGLLLTARAVCSCSQFEKTRATEYENGLSVVYEKQLGNGETRPSRDRPPIPIAEANRLQADIHHEMLQSVSSADRYPRGKVSLLDTQMVSRVLASSLRDAGPEANPRLADWPGVERKLASRVTHYLPSITRSELLEMPLARQVENFELTFVEAVALRRSIADIAAPKGPPPVKQRAKIRVPLLTGLGLQAARLLLGRVSLRLGVVTTVDSPLCSGTVVKQKPVAGGEATSDTDITVEIASGLSVRLPEIIGFGLSEAGCCLRGAGLRSEPSVEGRPGPNAEVVALEPSAGTLVTPMTAVTIQLKRRPEIRRPNKR